MKLVRLIKMCLNETVNLSDTFSVQNILKQVNS
jgi:hypothetical protein